MCVDFKCEFRVDLGPAAHPAEHHEHRLKRVFIPLFCAADVDGERGGVSALFQQHAREGGAAPEKSGCLLKTIRHQSLSVLQKCDGFL